MGLEFSECHFDGIEIGTVWRQEQEPGSSFLEDGFGPFAFVRGKIVEDDHIARLQRRGELGFDIDFEGAPVHRRIDHPGSGKSIVAQRGDEGLGSPMAEGGLHLEPLPSARATAEPGHLGGRAGLVDEHQPLSAFLHPGLAIGRPYPPPPDNVGAIGFARQQRFF